MGESRREVPIGYPAARQGRVTCLEGIEGGSWAWPMGAEEAWAALDQEEAWAAEA